ncbi:MAG: carbohydrate kinase family protein [Vicinamibacterales bacterium]
MVAPRHWPPPLRASASFDVVCVGESSLDVMAVLRGPVPDDGKAALAALKVRPGGQAATVAVGCARLGRSACFAGVLGTDAWARQVTEALEAEGVALAVRHREGVSTRAAVILVDAQTGRRAVLEYREPALSWRPDELPLDVVRDARILALDATDVASALVLARAARDAGVVTVLDADRDGADVAELRAAVDIVVMPEAVAREVGHGDVEAGLARVRRDSGVAMAVATLGPRGSVALVGDHAIRTPALDVPVVDTTGAGDAFRAGLMTAWLETPDRPDPERLLRMANTVAGLNCRALGAQTGLPAMAEVMAAQ